MYLYIGIVILGGIGALCRYLFDRLLAGYEFNFPVSTFLINILGSMAIGIIYVLGNEKGLFPKDLSLILSVGLLGGFTTFSAYSLQTVLLLKDSQTLLGLVYLTLSPLVCVTGTFIAVTVTRSLI